MKTKHLIRPKTTVATAGMNSGRHIYQGRFANMTTEEAECEAFEEMTPADLAAAAEGSHAGLLQLFGSGTSPEGCDWENDISERHLYHYIREAHERGVAVRIVTNGRFAPELSYLDPEAGEVDEEPEEVALVIYRGEHVAEIEREWAKRATEIIAYVLEEDDVTKTLQEISNYVSGRKLEHALSGVPLFFLPLTEAAEESVWEAVQQIALPWGGEIILQATDYEDPR